MDMMGVELETFCGMRLHYSRYGFRHVFKIMVQTAFTKFQGISS
jgi:hypothetical protein